VFLAAGHGTAAQEMRDAQATGPRDEIDIFTPRKREHFDLSNRRLPDLQIFF
jgi:hypothetical protein